MSSGENTRSDEVTVLVFKDNHAARTFRVPLKWISQIGFGLGLLVAISFLGLLFGLKYYRLAKQSSPAKMQDLEQELTDLKLAYQTLEAKEAQATKEAKDLKSTKDRAPTQSAAVPAPLPSAQPGLLPSEDSTAYLFTALSLKTLPPPAAVPITIEKPRFSWHGKVFRIHFAIQYNQDHGSQQGHIIVLGRGPELLVGYPEGLFNTGTGSPLIDTEKGESFSVSHFREVNADFKLVQSRKNLKTAEVLIVDPNGQILIHQQYPIDNVSGERTSRVPKDEAPTDDASSAPAADAVAPAPPATDSAASAAPAAVAAPVAVPPPNPAPSSAPGAP